MKPLLIRADASTQIGTGHVMRCLALAQAWQDAGGTAYFIVANFTPAIETRLCNEGFNVHYLNTQSGSADDAEQTIILARQIKATWVVVDGYHFGAAYQQAMKQAGLRLLVLDDYGHANHYYADLVLNQNIYTEASLYVNREPYTNLLLGTQYALLRREFWPWRGWRREIEPVAHKVLVTLGGADPDNVTLKVIQALGQPRFEDLEAVVAVGNSNPHWETLLAAVKQAKLAIRLERNVTNMPELMAWADMAISAGGSTCWELAFMGLPHLILILADNQQKTAMGLDSAKAAINLGDAAILSSVDVANALTELVSRSERWIVCAQRGQELVDGYGSARVVQQMNIHALTLRPVQFEDNHLIWEWANDPATRLNSFSSELITWESHLVWFKAKLADPQHVFYLALDAAATPIGQIRYKLNGQQAVVSMSLALNQRGHGYGSQVIRLASERIFEEGIIKQIHAYVKPANLASIQAFTKAGFVNEGLIEIEGCQALHLVRQKDRQL